MLKMLCANNVVRKAKYEVLKIMISGEMNAHIWELDQSNMIRRMGLHGSQRIDRVYLGLYMC